ncbi:hypothetical protein P7B04_10830 [Sphingobium yanoikuyae]|uniref:hypothetical protein n=1 Tax=Sphingobium yanoikuyae TaxID=13690 RepID=UPI00240EC030|nr:hypothetical protein [Sphingobium yanoikuyae]MDG2513187.1 hypothetical protein [Sphingobium yanoikuyae]
MEAIFPHFSGFISCAYGEYAPSSVSATFPLIMIRPLRPQYRPLTGRLASSHAQSVENAPLTALLSAIGRLGAMDLGFRASYAMRANNKGKSIP